MKELTVSSEVLPQAAILTVKSTPANAAENGPANERYARILIASGSSRTRTSLATLLKDCRLLELAAFAVDGCQGLGLVFLNRPELVILSARMPRMDGIETAYYVKQLRVPPRVVILCPADDPLTETRAKMAGADNVFIEDQEVIAKLHVVLDEHFGQNRPVPRRR